MILLFPFIFTASEWVSRKEGERDVMVKLDQTKNFISLQSPSGKPLRTIDLNPIMKNAKGDRVALINSMDKKATLLCVSVPKEYDLVSGHFLNIIR